MPFGYIVSPATAGNTTTNSSANTESDFLTIKPGTRDFRLVALYVIGKAAALTAISGIAIRLARFSTASTSGTSATPQPKDDLAPAAKQAAATGSVSAGSGRTNGLVIGCGVAGPGGWVARDDNQKYCLSGGGSDSIDAISISATASLNFEFSAETEE